MLDRIKLAFGVALALVAGAFVLLFSVVVATGLVITGAAAALMFRHASRPVAGGGGRGAIIDGECREMPTPAHER